MNSTYLIIDHHGVLYAVDARAVRELIWLPELTPAEEFPPFVPGIFNLRGKIVPVIDLDIRFGHTSGRYSISDVVVIIQIENSLVGLIVNEAIQVETVAQEAIDIPPEMALENAAPQKLLSGEIKLENGIAMIINVANLIKHGGAAGVSPEIEDYSTPAIHPAFPPDAEPSDKIIFRERALGLRRKTEEQNLSGFMPFAVIRMNGEHFAMDLNLILEFTNLKSMTPVPCCPSQSLF
ncbi:MAG: chemotaxis protein CheW [Nitrospinae bacterium]|nr:chemotaxis protein CheW [Nitrospinota bacterium]